MNRLDINGPEHAAQEIKESIASLQSSLENAVKVQNGTFERMEGDTSSHELSVKRCDLHGEYKSVRMFLPGTRFNTETRCTGCIQDSINKKQTELDNVYKTLKNKKIDRLTRESGIMPRFEGCTFEQYQAQTENARLALAICSKYAEKWEDRLSKGGGLVLCGKPGTGKNHLATCIAKQVIREHQNSVRITSAIKIIREIKNTWSRDSDKSEQSVIDSMKTVDLLIIDEVGVQFGSDTELMLMFEVINGRYEAMKPTILISNLSRDELSKFIGERVLDRMNEGGGATVVFDWESYRK